MMSDNKDNQVATTSKEIREGGSSVEAEMDEVMNAVDEEMRNSENNPEEEELMVSLDSKSLNRSRKKFQNRNLSQQLSTTPLKKRKINWWWPHSQDVFFLSSSVQVKQKEWKKIRFLPKSVSAYHYHSGTSCAVLRSGGRFDQSSERRRTRGLRIWPGRRRLHDHQSHFTDNSHQEVLRA